MAGNNATAALAAALGAPELSYQLSSAADIKPDATPWGPVAAVLLCLLPILFLLLTTLLKPLMLPSSSSLPLAAALLALVRLAYLSSPPLLVLAHMAVGALEGLIPLAVIFGAVLLFEAMAATGCLQFLMANVRCLSAGSPIAEVFLIGWAFAYTISGVGGFSTPMALAAPMLVSLGHDPLLSLVTVVGLNGLSAHLGSVGMAVWFGFKSLNLGPTAILHIGLKSAVVVGACSFVVAPAAASFLVPWRDLLCNAGFVLLSIASAVIPTVLFALFSAEFPLVAGGLISMAVTWLLIKFNIGLRPPCTLNTAADIETGDSNSSSSGSNKDSDTHCKGNQHSSDAAGSMNPVGGGVELAMAGINKQHKASLQPPPPAAVATVTAAVLSSEDAEQATSAAAAAALSSHAMQTSPHPYETAADDRVDSSARQARRPSSSSSSSSTSSRSASRLPSPFEMYCSLPLPDSPLPRDGPAPPDAPFTYTQATASAREASHYSAERFDSARRAALPAVIARRSQSLVAAAAAVGALTPSAAATGSSATTPARPACIFKCPSCAAEHAEIIAAEAAAAAALQQWPSTASDAAAGYDSGIAARVTSASSAKGASRRQQQQQQKKQDWQQQHHHQLEPAPEQQSQQQSQQQHQLLPALSVVNHSTGEHIIISGFDKLSGALRLLLHPGFALPFQGVHVSSTSHGWFGKTLDSNVVLSPDSPQMRAWYRTPLKTPHCVEVLMRTLPIWLTVLLLLVTHVPQLKLQDMLRSTTPSFTLYLGTLGRFSLSPALVVQLQAAFTQPCANWKAELLYAPCIIPFVVVSCITLLLYRKDVREAGGHWSAPFKCAWTKVSGTVSAMLGALVLAQLMSAGGRGSPAFIIAYYFTSWMGKGYLAIAGFLGALGSFVSGSVMGSNMTMGAIQAIAAQRVGVSATSLLAVQVAGACAGKMICVSSILSAKVVLSELNGVNESEIIRRTAPLALLFVVLAQLLGLVWTLAGLWPDVAV